MGKRTAKQTVTLDLIREIRESKGLSQRNLADKIGVDRSTISLIESGKRLPSLSTLNKIAKVLDTVFEVGNE